MSTFDTVSNLRPGRSVFDLSYEKKLTCDMGQLIPVMCDEMVPGDTFILGNEIVARFMPLVAPIMHEVNIFVHYFFVPYRLLWDQWEDWITGGIDGEFTAEIPRWNPSNVDLYSLWDYMGFPVGYNPAGVLPLIFPRNAYNFIYNEYYRDETLIDEVDLTQGEILNRCWEKDYFTSALPWQQRGTAPSLPITGLSFAEFDYDSLGIDAGRLDVRNSVGAPPNTQNRLVMNHTSPAAGVPSYESGTDAFAAAPIRVNFEASAADALSDHNVVDLDQSISFNVADLRLIIQVQRWLERNARGGARYTEFLKSHFGENPRDDRLQRPEYIGGSKAPMIVSEVLQTSANADQPTPQGNMAGHGLSASRQYVAKYHAQEFGLCMGIMSIMPRSAYQQGVDRQWLRRTKYDFYFPEFAHLSEQAIETGELVATGDQASNTTIFGYQGRYDEMRFKRNQVCADLRNTLDYWHLGRKFTQVPALNEEFITCVPSKRIFADTADPGLIINFGNMIKAIRPMPIKSEPGLMDH